jgi:cell wall-associated NlpC family hydrolase
MAHALSRLTRVAVVGALACQIAHVSHIGATGHDSRIDDAAGHPASNTLGRRIVAEAMAERGVPYSWGGGNTTGKTRGICCSPAGADGRETNGFDCSGLVLFSVYQATGGRIRLPRTAGEQTHRGARVTRAAMRPGDLIGFDHRDGQGVTHIGIYIGHGQMINAPNTGDVVKISPLAPRENQRWTIRRLH